MVNSQYQTVMDMLVYVTFNVFDVSVDIMQYPFTRGKRREERSVGSISSQRISYSI